MGVGTTHDRWSRTLRQRGATILALFAVLWVEVAVPAAGVAPTCRRREPDAVIVIAAVVVLCLVAGLPQLVAPLVCLVVGLHFLPLARSFDQPQYRWTAAGLCGAAVAALLVLMFGPNLEVARVVVGSVAAATLWATALRLALRG